MQLVSESLYCRILTCCGFFSFFLCRSLYDNNIPTMLNGTFDSLRNIQTLYAKKMIFFMSIRISRWFNSKITFIVGIWDGIHSCAIATSRGWLIIYTANQSRPRASVANLPVGYRDAALPSCVTKSHAAVVNWNSSYFLSTHYVANEMLKYLHTECDWQIVTWNVICWKSALVKMIRPVRLSVLVKALLSIARTKG